MEFYRLTIPIPKRPWQWIRFRLGTFLLLVAIVAISLAWWRDHHRLSKELYRLHNPSSGWGADQATGAPNTSGPSDSRTAWASAQQDDQQEWLLLEYDRSVIPKAILVHETYNPGAVFKVTHVPIWGKEQLLWEGKDPTPVGAGAGVSRLPVTTKIKTGRIKLYINSPAVPGWNEIDAVGIEYGNNEMIWADEATSSSTYGSSAIQTRGQSGVMLIR